MKGCRLGLLRSLAGRLSLSCVPGTVVCGVLPMKSPLLNFTMASAENRATLIDPRKCIINKSPQLFMETISLMLRLRAAPAKGVSRVGLQSYCVHASVAIAVRRPLLPCWPAVLPGVCPQVVGKAGTYPIKTSSNLDRRRS